MKKLLILLLATLLFFCLVACSNSSGGAIARPDNSRSTLSFKTLETTGQKVYGKVSNDTSTFSFLDEINIGSDTTYSVCLDMYCKNIVPSKTVSLNVGDNLFYILEKTLNQETLYTVTIRRKPIYTVRFTNKYDHAVCSSQKIEEDGTLIKPNDPTKDGYDFLGWDCNFPIVIKSDTTITSRWKINWEKMLSISNSTITGMKYPYINGDTKEIIIPSHIYGVPVTIIGTIALSSREWTEYIEVPDTVTHIETSAFRDCHRLEKIILSKNLEYIGDMAFDGCESLRTIEFNGTISEWKKITKGTNWNRKVPATQVICRDGNVSID